MDKCIIYGAGDFGHMACRELSRKYEILFLVDRNPAKEGTKVYDFEVRSPEVLKEYKDVRVFVAMRNASGVVEYVKSFGVKEAEHYFPEAAPHIPVPWIGAESQRLEREAPHELVKRLLPYDIISFDVFDTLLLRRCSFPRFLFYMMEVENGMRDFQYLRARAEDAVREEHKELYDTYEVTLEDIYGYIAPRTGVSVEEGVRRELEMEKNFLMANPYMKTVFDMLKQEGKRIILNSDMYLTKSQMEEVLNHCGYEGYEEIYVSSETKRDKGSGDSYEYIRKKYGKRKKYVHIGDNYLTDVVVAEKHGFDAIHYMNVNEAGQAYRADGMSDVVGPVYIGMVNAHLYNGLKQYTSAYEYGFIYGGLYVFGYLNWVHKYAREHNIEKILFLARDGDIYKQIYDKYYDIPSEYVYWSRISTEKFAIEWNRYEYVEHVFYSIEKMKGKHYKVADLLRERDIMFLEEKLHEYGFRMDHALTKEDARAFTDMVIDNIDAIRKGYEKNRKHLLEYLDGMLGGAKQVAIVDIGWYGSGPDALRRIFENYKPDIKTHCFLAAAGLSPLVQKEVCRPYIFSYIHNRNHYDDHHGLHKPQQAYIAFEMFNGSCSPSFSGIHGEDGEAVFEYSIPYVEGYEEIRDIQKGIREFCQIYKDLSDKYPCLKNVSGYDAYLPFRVALRDFNYLKLNFQDFPVEPEVGNAMEPLRLCKFI